MNNWKLVQECSSIEVADASIDIGYIFTGLKLYISIAAVSFNDNSNFFSLDYNVLYLQLINL